MGLTERRVRDAKAGGRTRVEWDDDPVGLGLRVTANGVKTFIFDYRQDGAKRRMALGRLGELSLSQARVEARELRKFVREGRNPIEERHSRKTAPTTSEALDRFLEEWVPQRMSAGRMSERTAKEYRRQIERHLRPVLGAMRVADVTQANIEHVLRHAPEDTRPGTSGRTPKGSPLPPVSANRIRALASKIFRKAEDWGWRPQGSNPARGIEKAVEEPRNRTLSTAELHALGGALSERALNEHAVLAIRLCALTGLRVSEVQSIKWEHLELEAGRLTLPKTKTGARVHTLPGPAIALLHAAKRFSDFVIPGKTMEGPLDVRAIRRAFEKACAAADIRGATLHDLRRSYLTRAAGLGANSHLVRDLVGHRTAVQADKYVRMAGEPLVELRERLGEGIAAEMSGQTGGVVPMRRKR